MHIVLSTGEVSKKTGIPREEILRLRRKFDIPGVARIKADSKPGRPPYAWSGRAIMELMARWREDQQEAEALLAALDRAIDAKTRLVDDLSRNVQEGSKPLPAEVVAVLEEATEKAGRLRDELEEVLVASPRSQASSARSESDSHRL